MNGDNNEIENICRTCLKNANDLKCIFKLGKICGEVTTLADMLRDLTSLEVYQDDNLPEKICTTCLLQLTKAFLFRQNCIKSNAKLHERIRSQAKVDTKIQKLDDNNDSKRTIFLYDADGLISAEHVTEYDINDKEENITYVQTNEIKQEQHTKHKLITLEEEMYFNENELINCTYVSEGTEEEEEGGGEAQVIQSENYEDNSNMYTISEGVGISDSGTDNVELIHLENTESQTVFSIGDGDIIESSISSNKNEEIQQIEDNMKINENLMRGRKRTHKFRMTNISYTCEICGKVLSNHGSYKYHKQLHSNETPYVCSVCGEKFKTRNACDGHFATHSNPHTCKICGKTYRQSSSLKSHMLTHTGEKPFKCPICGKGSTQKSGFKKHMLIHTDEKPHVCDNCGKKFRYSSNLLAHKRSSCHQNTMKTYICKICDECFTGTKKIRRHMIEVHRYSGIEHQQYIIENKNINHNDQEKEQIDTAGNIILLFDEK